VNAFSEEPLQIESAVLQELDFIGTYHFLFWHEGYGAAGPSLEERFVQVKKSP
jgi:hypothetical protein